MSSKNIIQKRSFVNFAMASTKVYHNPHLKAKPKTHVFYYVLLYVIDTH